MINQVLLYVGSFLLLIWGVAHITFTRSVVDGFGDISLDNRRVLTMEWVVEGMALIFICAVVSAVTCVDHTSRIARTVY